MSGGLLVGMALPPPMVEENRSTTFIDGSESATGTLFVVSGVAPVVAFILLTCLWDLSTSTRLTRRSSLSFSISLLESKH